MANLTDESRALLLKDMDRKARRRQTLAGKIGSLKAELDELDNSLKTDLQTLEVDAQRTAHFLVSNKMIFSSRFDQTTFRVENEELARRYIVPNNYRKFTVTC